MAYSRTDNLDLSICVPTRKRASLLRRTLESILEAELQPSEVLIGDNGGFDEATRAVVVDLQDRLPLRHVVHDPPLTYGGNLRFLLGSTRAAWLGLIHDDDFYTPSCGALLRQVIGRKDIDFWFSNHSICSHEGLVDPEASRRNNQVYQRHLLARGPVEDPLAAVLRNQVCMDGWFARSEPVRQCSPDERWMDFADVQYLTALATKAPRWFFETEDSFVYRTSLVGLTSAGLRLHVLYGFLQSLSLSSPLHARIRDERLRRYAPGAVACWLREGNQLEARRCLRGGHYPFPFSLRGAARLAWQLAKAYAPGTWNSHSR
jgi:hypothetical protein